MSNEIGQLFQGIGGIQGTNTCFFIHRHEVPQDDKVTYFHIVCNIRPQKKYTHIVRLTVGGYRLTFEGPVSTPTSNVITSKLHWNSGISTPGSRYLVVDVKNFYLNNVMAKHEFYNISISLIPQEVIDEYDLMDKQINVFLYVRVEKGMYGLFLPGISHTFPSPP